MYDVNTVNKNDWYVLRFFLASDLYPFEPAIIVVFSWYAL